MKKTGNESNQGHRAKMNSSDRFGLDQSVESDGWTKVISKSAKRLARKKEEQVYSSTNKKSFKKKKNSKGKQSHSVANPPGDALGPSRAEESDLEAEGDHNVVIPGSPESPPLSPSVSESHKPGDSDRDESASFDAKPSWWNIVVLALLRERLCC